MDVQRLTDARPYPLDPPGQPKRHHGVKALRLQGAEVTGMQEFMVGLSYYLPGACVDDHNAETDKVYIVLNGHLTVTANGQNTVLGPMDSCRLVAGEPRRVDNLSNEMASMFVIIPT